MRAALVLLLAAGLAACRGEATDPTPAAVASDPSAETATGVEPLDARAAAATLRPLAGSGVEGTVRISSYGERVRVVAEADGLARDGVHALHVLATASCDDPGEAPAHFDPDGRPHGSPYAAPDARHAGDLGNLTADDEGHARYDRFDGALALDGPRSAVGHAVVVRAGQDDVYSASEGSAGAVLACGVLEPAR